MGILHVMTTRITVLRWDNRGIYESYNELRGCSSVPQSLNREKTAYYDTLGNPQVCNFWSISWSSEVENWLDFLLFIRICLHQSCHFHDFLIFKHVSDEYSINLIKIHVYINKELKQGSQNKNHGMIRNSQHGEAVIRQLCFLPLQPGIKSWAPHMDCRSQSDSENVSPGIPVLPSVQIRFSFFLLSVQIRFSFFIFFDFHFYFYF